MASYTGVRFPFEELEARVRRDLIARRTDERPTVFDEEPSVTMRDVAIVLGFHDPDDPRPAGESAGVRRVHRLRGRGLREREADELAVLIGEHPRLIWPEWGDSECAKP